MRAIDPPDRASNGDRLWINTSLDLGITTKQSALTHVLPSRNTHRPILSVTDRVRAAVEKISVWHRGELNDDGYRESLRKSTVDQIWSVDKESQGSALSATEIKRALRALRG